MATLSALITVLSDCHWSDFEAELSQLYDPGQETQISLGPCFEPFYKDHMDQNAIGFFTYPAAGFRH